MLVQERGATNTEQELIQPGIPLNTTILCSCTIG